METVHRLDLFRILLTLAVIVMAVRVAYGRGEEWAVGFSAESGTPSGFVQVRENRIVGTRLPFRSALGVSRITTLRMIARRRLGPKSLLKLSLSGTQITGVGTLSRTAYFNGTTLQPGPISSDTHFLDNWRLTAAYWYRVLGFGPEGGLWLSGGLTYVGLNFKIGAGVAPGSVGHETKEDFITQELPIPVFGIHLDYPLHGPISLFADFEDGHIPWTNSLRWEGGMVQLTQTNQDADLGLRFRMGHSWSVRLYAYDRYFMQNERSGEDGNFIRLDEHGIGLRFVDRF